MSRGAWITVRNSKRFYATTYRLACRALVVSVSISIVLCLSFYYVYFNRPEHDFYSTDGVTPPVSLMPMDEPNYSDYPLLANDQTVDESTKVIPK